MNKPLQSWHYLSIVVLFALLMFGLWKWSFRSNLSHVDSQPYAAGPNVDKAPDETKLKEFGEKLIEERRSGKR